MARKTPQQDAESQQAVSWILISIITFLVMVITYRWFQSAGKRKNTKTQDNAKTKAKEDSTISKEEDDEDSSTIDDVLVKASDIKPLDDAALEKISKGDCLSPAETIEDVHNKHHTAKDLEEEVAKTLSQEQLAEEAKVRQDQLAAIFKLMEENKDRFGVDSMTDVTNQYKLYN